MKAEQIIPVIDMFAGPGGLGEGFASYEKDDGSNPFKVRLSVEKEESAYQTLRLRSFYRQFPRSKVPTEYYEFLRGNGNLDQRLRVLYDKFPDEAENAAFESWCAELGEVNLDLTQARIRTAVDSAKHWILVGGPPCQAYSLAGRSRNRGNKSYEPENDSRQFLYVEFLQTLADHEPTVFILENVKGLLSATVNNQYIFSRMLDDLRNPAEAVIREGRSVRNHDKHRACYRIHSLVRWETGNGDLNNYVVRMEDHGIPQARHRLIVIGVREDAGNVTPQTLLSGNKISARSVLTGLPRLRSGLSKEDDSPGLWINRLQESLNTGWFSELTLSDGKVAELLEDVTNDLSRPRENRGAEFIPFNCSVDYRKDWYLDSRLKGACNHSTRSHIVNDLYRYLFAACYTRIHNGRSPVLNNFPAGLLPEHGNVDKAMGGGNFADRFRVQPYSRPSTTITSHISKDGHYYIHPDPTQCRSLTVREAARLQTFPDNYFFCGPRTSQYVQVGNAVPPLLAVQIAEIVFHVLKDIGSEA